MKASPSRVAGIFQASRLVILGPVPNTEILDSLGRGVAWVVKGEEGRTLAYLATRKGVPIKIKGEVHERADALEVWVSPSLRRQGLSSRLHDKAWEYYQPQRLLGSGDVTGQGNQRYWERLEAQGKAVRNGTGLGPRWVRTA
jgi:GNAT superfamily N-acetyltransferase